MMKSIFNVGSIRASCLISTAYAVVVGSALRYVLICPRYVALFYNFC